MAAISILIGQKSPRTKESPVSILLSHNKSKKKIPTGISVSDADLSTNRKKIKNPRKYQIVEKIRRELEDRLFEMSLELMENPDVDASYIAQRLLMKRGSIDFFEFADAWLERCTVGGKKNYVTMLKSFEKFLGVRKIGMESITYQVLSKYEMYLQGKPRAQSLYLSSMRHLYREAMREYNTDYETVIKNDPFLRYKTPRQIIRKGMRALTLEQLHKIYDYSSEIGRAQLARDCFIMSFCMMGMNSADMFDSDAKLKEDTICYRRAKTRGRRSDEAYIEVKVHPFVSELIAKYKGEKRVFNFYNRYRSMEDFNRALNIGLKDVGAACGIDGLQFYQARHTFATLSRNLMRFSKSDVDEALNHVGSLDIADIYIAKDFQIINDNNFKLIERVFALK